MSKYFEADLNKLLSLIRNYQTSLKAAKQKTPEQVAYFDTLKTVYKGLKMALQQSQQQQNGNCSIKKFSVLTPLPTLTANNKIRSSFLPKVKVVLQIFTAQEACIFTDETIHIRYKKGREEKILIRELIDANNQVTFFLSFKEKENDLVFLDIGGFNYRFNRKSSCVRTYFICYSRRRIFTKNSRKYSKPLSAGFASLNATKASCCSTQKTHPFLH